MIIDELEQLERCMILVYTAYDSSLTPCSSTFVPAEGTSTTTIPITYSFNKTHWKVFDHF